MSEHLTNLIDRYVDRRNEDRPIGRELSSETKACYVHIAMALRAYLGREPTINDLTHHQVNAWLGDLLKTGRSAYTVKSYRTRVLVLMRFVKSEGRMSNAEPDRVRRIHCDRLEIKGYGTGAMLQLLNAAAEMKGVVKRTGINRRIYLVSMLLLMWNIGCRIGDIKTIRVSKFDSTGRLWVFENKTRKSRWHRLHPITRDAIAACIAAAPAREFIWPGYSSRNICRMFVEFAKAVGVGGSSKYIRRGSASAFDRLSPGQGWRFLNHSDPRVFEQHYRDAELSGDDQLMPPALPCSEAIVRLCNPQVNKPAPKRKPSSPSRPTYSSPAVVPLAEAAKDALSQHPFTDAHLAVVVSHLSAIGITQRQLAEWWGVAFKRYQDFRYGYRQITLQAADRLRRAFMLPTQAVACEGPIPLGSLAATPDIAERLAAKQFEAAELKAICSYIKQSLGITKQQLAISIGVFPMNLHRMEHGRMPVANEVQAKLRGLFDLNESDAA